MNRLTVGSIVLTGRTFYFSTPKLSLYSTAAFGQLLEPEVEIMVTDNGNKLNPFSEFGFYTKDTLYGEEVRAYDYDDTLIYLGVITRFDVKGQDLVLYCQSPLAYRMTSTVSLSITKSYPSDAVYQALVQVGLSQYIDQASFDGAAAYYSQYPQTIMVETGTDKPKLVDVIDAISKLCSVSIARDEYGKIAYRVLGAHVPVPAITLTAETMITEPSKVEDSEIFNNYSIQIMDDSETVAVGENGPSVSRYGLNTYTYTPTAGVYVTDYASGQIFGERKCMLYMYPLRKIKVGLRNNVLSAMGDDVVVEYVNNSFNGTYMVVAKDFDAYVTELTLQEQPVARITEYLSYLVPTGAAGYGYGIYNTGVWGR